MEFLLSLRITGNDLQPDEISKKLKLEPSKSQTRGQIFKSAHSGKERVSKFGMWFLESSTDRVSDLNAEIIEFANKFPKSPNVWTEIGVENEVDFYCGFFMGKSNDMLYLSPEAVKAISSFGASITLDTYDANDE